MFDAPAPNDPDTHSYAHGGAGHGLGHASWGNAHRCTAAYRLANQNQDAGVITHRSKDRYALSAPCLSSADAYVIPCQSIGRVRGLYCR